MYKDKKIIDKIEIINLYTIQVRKALIVYKDDIEIAVTYERFSYEPGQDISGEDLIIQDIAKVLWRNEENNVVSDQSGSV